LKEAHEHFAMQTRQGLAAVVTLQTFGVAVAFAKLQRLELQMATRVSKFEKFSSFISKSDKRIAEVAEIAKIAKQSIPCKFHGRGVCTKGENCPCAHVDIAANNVSKGEGKSKGEGLPKPNIFGSIAMANHGWKPVLFEKQALPTPPISNPPSQRTLSVPNDVPWDRSSAKGTRVDEGAVEASAKGA
jgi:hypothetical protein